MSDPTALVAELRAGKVGPLPDGWDMGHYEEAVQRLFDRAADLIAQQAATIEAATKEASGLAVALWRGHYLEAAPDWRPFDDPVGLLTQIDNMTAGLREKLQVERARANAAEAEMDAIAAALPGVRFMDPPDGGSPTLAEQVGRMSAALTAAEAERDRLREALKAAKGWLEGWASAERELAVIDAALSTAKERVE